MEIRNPSLKSERLMLRDQHGAIHMPVCRNELSSWRAQVNLRRVVHRWVCAGSSASATRLALSRMAREALVTEIVALDIQSMSAPTLNASRMFLPLNCAGNAGRSMERKPYGS